MSYKDIIAKYDNYLFSIGIPLGHDSHDVALLEVECAFVFAVEVSQGLHVVVLTRTGLNDVLVQKVLYLNYMTKKKN